MVSKPALFGLVLAACSSSDVQDAPSPSPTSPVEPPITLESVEKTGQECGRTAAELGSWLTDIVLAPGSAKPPEPTAMEEKLAPIRKLDRAEASPQLTAVYWEATARCLPARGVLQAVRAADRDSQMEVLAERLPIALAECNCQVNIPEFRALLWDLNQRYNPRVHP